MTDQQRQSSPRNAALSAWQDQEAAADDIIVCVGRLYRERSIICTVFKRSLVNQSSVSVIKSHNASKHIPGAERVSPHDTLPIVQELLRERLRPSYVDVGRLAVQYREARDSGRAKQGLRGFLEEALFKGNRVADLTPEELAVPPPRDVVLYGFGRIGRCVARMLIEKTGGGEKLRLRAVIVRDIGDLRKRASLLRADSVHGPFRGEIRVDEGNNTLIINGNMVRFAAAPKGPGDVDYAALGVRDALLVDNTGKFRKREELARHRAQPGAIAKVVLTAPAGEPSLRDVVVGVNDADLLGAATFDDLPDVLAAASCTTNAVSPVLKAMNDKFGVVSGHIETIHSYTNDQNLVDNYHKKERRGRAAAVNMVITETGAASAVARVLPELAGKFTGNAVRVPTPNVSLAILHLRLRDVPPGGRDAVNEYLRDQSLDGPLCRQIDYRSSGEVASCDLVGNRAAGIVDSQATSALDDSVNLYVWYDNESGYSAQVVRLLQILAMQHKFHPKLPRSPAAAAAAK